MDFHLSRLRPQMRIFSCSEYTKTQHLIICIVCPPVSSALHSRRVQPVRAVRVGLWPSGQGGEERLVARFTSALTSLRLTASHRL